MTTQADCQCALEGYQSWRNIQKLNDILAFPEIFWQVPARQAPLLKVIILRDICKPPSSMLA